MRLHGYAGMQGCRGLLLSSSGRITRLVRRQFHDPAVAPYVDGEAQAGVLVDGLSHCDLKGNFGPLLDR